MAAIALRNLQKTVEQHTLIDIETLDVERGEIAAIIGAVGSGTDTLLALLLGQMQPTVGTLELAENSPRKAISNRIGVVFADDRLYQRQSVRDNLIFFARLYGLSAERVNKVLQAIGLADHARMRVDKLSSSLARRLTFGRAILHEPEVLLLVDPFVRCDEPTVSLLSKLLRELAEAELGILILGEDTTHMHALCDTVHLMKQGQIVETYQPQDTQLSTMPFKVPVQREGKVVLLNAVDVLYAYVDDGHVYLQTDDERLPSQFTLSQLEQRLVRSGFFRAHRAYLVNLQHVKEIIPYTRNSFNLRLTDADETLIPLR